MPQLNEAIPDVFILCGGQGTRFREVREDIPKALAPINDNVFLDLLLNYLLEQGCRRVILGTGYLSEQIEIHLKKRNDAEFIISREKHPLGTGGAILNALPLLESEQVIVLNGDSYIAFSLKELLNFHKDQRAEATILLSSVTTGKDYGNVELNKDQRILSFHEKSKDSKSRLINAGVYCLQKKLIQRQQGGFASLERDWVPNWLSNECVMGLVLSESFYDIGTFERFKLAQDSLGKLEAPI